MLEFTKDNRMDEQIDIGDGGDTGMDNDIKYIQYRFNGHNVRELRRDKVE